MPTVLDSTVVSSAYDTSGNGGRKLVRLNDGTLISAVKVNTTAVNVYKSTNNGTTWTQIYTQSISINDVSIATNGTYIYLFYSYSSAGTWYYCINSSGTSLFNAAVDQTQTAMGNGSLAYNASDNTLHAAWASKNGTYPNSFGIRYAKGTINTDGSVTWGAVTQIATANYTGRDIVNPTIGVNGSGKPFIIYSSDDGSGHNGTVIACASPSISGVALYVMASGWGEKIIYSGAPSYAQSSPSAIFVPQSINGLANGRIWVAWFGQDSTDTTMSNIRASYSDDGGVTWSAMQKLTSGNTYSQAYPTITANKNNKIFILWQGYTSNQNTLQVREISYDGTSWSSITNKTSMTSTNNASTTQPSPSSLFDLTMNMSEPLFIYRNNDSAKVGFYGTWVVTTISVTPGAIGTVSNKNNLLSYSITTDGTMSTVTEAINGTNVNTKTPASGASTTVTTTQSQWDAIKYGKYKDTSANLNTLTVSMGSDSWTYTFDKRLSTTDDMLHAMQATSDTQTTFIPAQLARLASALTSKNATVPSTPKFDDIVGAINSMSSKRFASGTCNPSTTGTSLQERTGAGNTTSSSAYLVTVSGLTFQPSVIQIFGQGSYPLSTAYNVNANYYGVSACDICCTYDQGTSGTDESRLYDVDGTTLKVTSSGFVLPVISGSSAPTLNWIAYE